MGLMKRRLRGHAHDIEVALPLLRALQGHMEQGGLPEAEVSPSDVAGLVADGEWMATALTSDGAELPDLEQLRGWQNAARSCIRTLGAYWPDDIDAYNKTLDSRKDRRLVKSMFQGGTPPRPTQSVPFPEDEARYIASMLTNWQMNLRGGLLAKGGRQSYLRIHIPVSEGVAPALAALLYDSPDGPYYVAPEHIPQDERILTFLNRARLVMTWWFGEKWRSGQSPDGEPDAETLRFVMEFAEEAISLFFTDPHETEVAHKFLRWQWDESGYVDLEEKERADAVLSLLSPFGVSAPPGRIANAANYVVGGLPSEEAWPKASEWSNSDRGQRFLERWDGGAWVGAGLLAPNDFAGAAFNVGFEETKRVLDRVDAEGVERIAREWDAELEAYAAEVRDREQP